MTATTDDATLFRRQTADAVDDAYRIACLILGDRLEAEDVVQDALLAAWASRRSLRDPASFGAWFGRIVVNKCRDRQRSPAWSRRMHVPVAEAPPEVDPARGDLEVVERDAMRRALSALDSDHRTVVVLRYYADLPVDAIAARMGIRPGTVKSRLHYALGALRAAFDAANQPGPARRADGENSR